MSFSAEIKEELMKIDSKGDVIYKTCNVTNFNEKDYICISDIAKAKSDKSRAADVIRNWLRNRSTLDFLYV